MKTHSSEEDTEWLEDYIGHVYRQLKRRNYEVKVARNVFECPFCPGKRRQEYSYNELVQHARGVANSSMTWDLKGKGRHQALFEFVEKYYGPKVSTKAPLHSRPVLPKESLKPNDTSNSRTAYEKNERFVWPWKGIIANLPIQKVNGKFVGDSGSKLRDDLIRDGYNPLKVIPLWSREGHSGYAVVNFSKDFAAFGKAMAFEKSFESQSHGRQDWYSSRPHDDKLYGWVARQTDYNSSGLIGKHLRDNADLKSIEEVQNEEERKTACLVSDLTKTKEIKEVQCKEMQSKLQETCASINKVMQEKDDMSRAYNEETIKIQKKTMEDTKKIIDDHEKFKLDLEFSKEKLERREQNLSRREADYDDKVIQLRRLRKMNELATVEQKKADEKVCRLVEEQKREKEELHKKLIDLQKELDDRQALELEIEQLRGRAHVMEHMERNAETKKQMKDIDEELLEKEEELEHLETLTQTLIVKERKCNEELQEARKELIKGLEDSKFVRAAIGVKWMGFLGGKVFTEVAKGKYPAKEVPAKANEQLSLCRTYIEDHDWNPYKTVLDNGNPKAVIDEEDERLQSIKAEMGEEVWEAMKAVMSELNEYNPSGRYAVVEMWNHKEERKASLKEGAEFILNKWKTLKKTKKR